MSDKQLSETMCLQDVAMNLLATGYSRQEVAKMLGIAVRTIDTWGRRNPSFRATLKSLREQGKQRQPQRKRR